MLAELGRSTKTEVRMRDRARIVLLAAEGVATREIGRIVGCTTETASEAAGALRARSSRRSRRDRPSGCRTRIRSCRAEAHPRDARSAAARWIRELDSATTGACAWRCSRAVYLALPARPKDRSVGPQVLVREQRSGVRGQGGGRSSACIWRHRENAVVLSVDEEPSIQGVERAQGYLKLPTGRALIGQSHHYKRHGTTTLFAALEVATGKVTGRHYNDADASSFSTS